MPKSDITLQCKECGHTTNRPAYCPYTGHRHSEGWVYKCSECRGDMKEVSYREGGACAFMVPDPGEPWITVHEWKDIPTHDYPEQSELAALKPNFIELNRNRVNRDRVLELEYTTAEPDFVYAIQVKRYTGNTQWETRATAKREGLARLLYESMLKFKGYGEEVRIRKIDPFNPGKATTVNGS